jgi:release factor family 10
MTAKHKRKIILVNAKRLQFLSQLPSPLLTVYLDTKRAEAFRHGLVPDYLTWLKNEAKSLARSVPAAEEGFFHEQLKRIEEFLRGRMSQERGLVIFAGTAAREVVSLQVEVKNELRWGKPALSQLLCLANEHKPYCIVAVDRAGARFFRYGLGGMTNLAEKKFEVDISQWKKKELGHVTGQSVQKTRGSQRDTFDHRMDAQFEHLCRETATLAKSLCEREGLSAIFLVGSDRLIKPIEAGFPQEFRPRIVSVEEDLARIPFHDLQQRLEPKIAKWERDRSSALVNALLGNDRGTVAGIDETLAQIQKGKIRTLVLVRDLDANLSQCVQCGWADRSSDPVCPACGSKRRSVTLRDVLPELILHSEIEVEVVTGEAAAKLKEAGGVGARLRQPKQTDLNRVATRAT